MNIMRQKNREGFTLLEAVAAISILGLALSLAAPAAKRMIKNREAGVCRESRIRIQTVIQADKAQREDLDSSFQELLEDYTERYGQFCPSGGEFIWEEEKGRFDENRLFVRCSIHK